MNKKYIEEINFLRFISITTVIIYHYFPEIIPKGFLGVDLFFVISGFLISLYIYQDIIEKKFDFVNFYNRRIKRILPASIFLLIFISFASLIFFTDVDLKNYSKSLIYSIFFSSNFFFWLDGGYFGPNDKLKPLLHFWSLGVEEQFYIFFPFLFYFFLKFSKNLSFLIFVISLVVVISLLLNLFLIKIGGSNPAFFLMPTRIWNFGFGILAMALLLSGKKYHGNLEVFFYLSMIFIGFYYQPKFLPINFLVIFFTFMLLKKKFPKKFFLDFIIRNSFLQYIGLISFSLYLWHWPILTFVKYYFVYEINLITKILTLILSIAISMLSYHFIELKFRYKIKINHTYKILLVSYVIFVLFFIFINFTQKKLYSKNSPNFIGQSALTNFKCDVRNYKFYFNKRGCEINFELKKIDDPDIAIIGNSHAQMYVPSIKPHLIKNNKKAILLPMTGCLPTIDININKECIEISKNYFLDYSMDENIQTIIIATTWWHKKIFNGKKFIDDPQHLILGQSLLDLVKKLNLNDKNVFLVGPIQVPLYELPQNLSRLLKFNHINNEQLINMLKVKKQSFDQEYMAVIRLLSQKLKNNFIQPHKIQCDVNYCYYSNNEGVYFADGSHISKTGSKIFSKSFEIIFE